MLTDDLVQNLFSSCPASFNLKKYKWPCDSGEDLNMFVPYDVSKMEIYIRVSDSGAFHRQTAAEIQTEVASLSFVEVFLDSLTSWLVCYCNGKLHVQGHCLFS